MNRENIRWITSFVVLMAVFYWIDQSSWFQELVLDKLSLFTANATAWILSFIGLHLKQTGVTLFTPTGPVNIAKSCTGSFVFLMFAAAICCRLLFIISVSFVLKPGLCRHGDAKRSGHEFD